MISAAFGCVFGILGILTIGIVFVPLAFICATMGISSAAFNLNVQTAFVSSIALVLTAIGWVMSPSLWVLTGAIIAASN